VVWQKHRHEAEALADGFDELSAETLADKDLRRDSTEGAEQGDVLPMPETNQEGCTFQLVDFVSDGVSTTYSPAGCNHAKSGCEYSP
jgi:hypothetical protein